MSDVSSLYHPTGAGKWLAAKATHQGTIAEFGELGAFFRQEEWYMNAKRRING